MKNHSLFALWGGLFIVCAGLGFIPEPEGAVRILMTGLSLLFFVPPALLLHRGDRVTVLLVRNLSLLSLVLTLIALVLNFLLALSSETLGTVLHYVLVILSSPMVCSCYWALSLFLWACLLIVSGQMLKGK